MSRSGTPAWEPLIAQVPTATGQAIESEQIVAALTEAGTDHEHVT